MPLAFVFCSWYKTCVSTNVTPLADKLQAARAAKGLSPTQLAAAAGCTEAAVRMWERGDREPGGRFLVRLAAALDRDPAWFYEEEVA